MAGGIIKFPNINDMHPKNSAQIKNGFSNLLKLIPLVKIAIISVSFAILEVKNVTDRKINKGLNRFIK